MMLKLILVAVLSLSFVVNPVFAKGGGHAAHHTHSDPDHDGD